MKARWMIAMLAVAALVCGAGLNAEEKKAAKDPLASAKCPVSGKAVKAESCVEHNGGKVYFCCDNCPKEFAANTAKYSAKANQQLVTTGQAKQALCPRLGKKLNPATATDVGGTKVCFCCNNCKGAVAKADAAKQLEMVFGDAAFAKGFKVAAAKK